MADDLPPILISFSRRLVSDRGCLLWGNSGPYATKHAGLWARLVTVRRWTSCSSDRWPAASLQLNLVFALKNLPFPLSDGRALPGRAMAGQLREPCSTLVYGL
jgi:hypothetical protein